MAHEIAAPTRVLPRFEERPVQIISLKRMLFTRFLRHRGAVAGIIIETLLLFFAFLGPFVTPYTPDQVNLRERFAPPSAVMLAPKAPEKAIYNLDAINLK